MPIIAALYVVVSSIFIGAALGIVWYGVRAYATTQKPSMIHLAMGFSMFVAAAATTLISTFLFGFEVAAWNLLVQNGITSAGLLMVLYSLITYP